MITWDLLIDESALAALLPQEFARYAGPIRRGLILFLSRLDAAHQDEIIARQQALQVNASLAERLGDLAYTCPVLQKLGQILARDQRLAETLREQLRKLESQVPTIPLTTIQETLEAELGPLEPLGIRLVPPAIAQASVAVVIPFEQQQAGSLVQGVFKVLKPGIETRLHAELNLLAEVGACLDDASRESAVPQLDYAETFAQVHSKLMDEVSLRQEQAHLRAAKAFYADLPEVQIPTVLVPCTDRVTAMERVFGVELSHAPRTSPAEQRRFARLMVRAMLAYPMFASDSLAWFHADPHAGNLLRTDDGRLAILDWSLAGTLTKPQRTAIVQLILKALLLDAEGMVTQLCELATRPPVAIAALRVVVQEHLRQLWRGQVPGLSWLVSLLDQSVQIGLRVETPLLLFRKSLYTLEGNLRGLGIAAWEIDAVLIWEFVRRFVAEWPKRCWSLADSRDYATCVSNWDLAQAWCAFPVSAARWWLTQSQDLLKFVGTVKN